MSAIFHFSIPISDFAAARKFYGEVLGCPESRAEVDRIDFDFCGHQFATPGGKCHNEIADHSQEGCNHGRQRSP